MAHTTRRGKVLATLVEASEEKRVKLMSKSLYNRLELEHDGVDVALQPVEAGVGHGAAALPAVSHNDLHTASEERNRNSAKSSEIA